MLFESKVAVVTGGGSGIGAGICKALAQEGATVIVTDRDLESAKQTVAEIQALGYRATAKELDVTKAEQINQCVSEIKETYGTINHWVNNAGISKITPFFNHTKELWNTTLDINLTSQFSCCQAVIPVMLEGGGGSIVNMSSQSGKVGTDSYQAYCTSKFGVIGLTQSLAKEFGKHGIRVNSVCPGVVYTPMWDQQKADYGAKKNIDPDQVMGYFKDKIPLKRLGTVEDIANVVCFLLSDKSAYMTGQALNVNGGDIMF